MNQRAFKFTVGASSLLISATDFWVEHRTVIQSGSRLYSCVLHQVREGLTGSGQARRIALENRITVLQAFMGLTGTLEINYGQPALITKQHIRLANITPRDPDKNAVLQYDIEFDYPSGEMIARTLQFGADADADKIALNAENFTVVCDREDRTQFTPVFRAAPVRIEAGPGLKTIRVQGTRQAVAGETPLALRQAAEAVIKEWNWNQKGRARLLKIDGADWGTCHFQGATVSEMGLPDAVVYELAFVTGFGQ